MKTIQEMLQELSQCIVTVSGEFRFRTNWNGGKVPQPDLDTFDPNVPFCIENVGDVQASVQYNTKNTNIRISKDYKTWNDYTTGTEIELNPKDRVYIKSDYVKDTGYNPRFVFNGDGTRLRARGNIASLIYGTNDAYVSKYTSTEEYCYYYMFNGCKSIVQAPELPATKLAQGCYSDMFSGCTSLTQAPELPATTLASNCYAQMFKGCTSLTKAPELPATILVYECYSHMFEGCIGLTQAPELPATNLFTRCYQFMFYGCKSLTQAPELPATTLAYGCYQLMFQKCTSLAKAPELPATTLVGSCYVDMFNGCTSLTQAPELSATTLADYCYRRMFEGCTSLTQAPELPATKLANGCYENMFSGCTSLTQAPELPAIGLLDECYNGMFSGCTSLTQAPELPATAATKKCYNGMFSGCSKLNYVKCFIEYTLADNCLDNWLNNVSPTGDFYCMSDINLSTGASGIPEGWHRHAIEIEPEGPQPDLDIFDPTIPFCLVNDGDAITVITYKIPYYNIKFSKDGKIWNDFQPKSPISLRPQRRLYIKSDYSTYDINASFFTFSGSDKIRARGNIASLIYGTNDEFITKYDSTERYCYNRLFMNCTSLTQAPELPATKLAQGCYRGMFDGCTSLVQAPELHATTLAVSCYNSMFSGCTSLTQAPELPATTLASNCYDSMFYNCTSLTQAPELPVTTLANYCYNRMFSSCTSLTQAPELLATTLVYACYNKMFQYCTKLNYVKCLATNISSDYYTSGWLENVSPTGDFYTPAATTWSSGISGIPSGWTRHDIT